MQSLSTLYSPYKQSIESLQKVFEHILSNAEKKTVLIALVVFSALAAVFYTLYDSFSKHQVSAQNGSVPDPNLKWSGRAVVNSKDSPTSINKDLPQFRLLLNFDINGTLVLHDSTKKDLDDDYMLICVLAKTTFACWEAGTPPMSFKQYVDTKLIPGSRSDKTLIKQRQAAIAQFLDWEPDQLRPDRAELLEIKSEVKKKYDLIKSKFADPVTNQLQFPVFPSFYVMLDKLRKMGIPFTIILRTFGNDLDKVTDELRKPDGIAITRWAKYEDLHFKIQKEGEEEPALIKTAHKAADIFDLIISSDEHLGIHDDWSRWNKDEERSRSGKPFLYDGSQSHEIKTLSLFFDDNITDDDEKNIICPQDIRELKATPKELYERKLIFPVNTVEAILDENYFINCIIEAIKCNRPL